MASNIIHMNVSSCRDLGTKMESVRTDTETQFKSLTGQLDGMIGTDWIAPAADKYKGDLDSWASQAAQLLSNLADLKAALDREITEWESTAAG